MYGTTTSGTLAATGEDGPYHRGAILVSLRTIVPYYQQGIRSITVEPVSPLLPVKLNLSLLAVPCGFTRISLCVKLYIIMLVINYLCAKRLQNWLRHLREVIYI